MTVYVLWHIVWGSYGYTHGCRSLRNRCNTIMFKTEMFNRNTHCHLIVECLRQSTAFHRSKLPNVILDSSAEKKPEQRVCSLCHLYHTVRCLEWIVYLLKSSSLLRNDNNDIRKQTKMTYLNICSRFFISQVIYWEPVPKFNIDNKTEYS